MDTTTVIWGIGFPLLLFFIALGAGTAFAMTSSDSVGFLVAKLCLAAAAFDVVIIAVYWAIATRQSMPWNVAIPTIAAIIAIPALVLSAQWIGSLEIRLSTHLFPADSPTPELPRTAIEIPKDALKVFLGSSIAWATRMPFTILSMGGEKMIEVDKDEKRGDLVVTVLKIFDDRNNIIARIDDEDGFWVENSTRRKRPDPSTLVVYDHSDTEVLRIKFMNRSTLYVTGIFRRPGMRTATISPDFLELSGNKFVKGVFGGGGIEIR